MAFCWTTIHVADLEKSIEFYQEAVGLKVIREVEPRPGVSIAFMGERIEGETQLELLCDTSKTSYPASDQVTVGYTVDSLHGKLDLLKALGIEPYSDIFQPNPRIKFFYVKDPDGISVQFVEFVDPEAEKDI